MHMIEFLFGVFIGVWMGQTMPLPSVHKYVLSLGSRSESGNITSSKEVSKEAEELDQVPLFTGDMPTELPSV